MIDISGLLPLIASGFGWGALHALDTDHVVTISSLSNHRLGARSVIVLCLSWASGHAAVIIFSGILLFGMGFHLPAAVVSAAELAVGVFLIVLGALFFLRLPPTNLAQPGSTRLFNKPHPLAKPHPRHAGIPPTATLRSRSQLTRPSSALVGGLHGFAGSAPVLAVVPILSGPTHLGNALVYLLIFSLGMTVSMLLFGLCFVALQAKLQAKYRVIFFWQRRFIAGFSIVFGLYWVGQTL